MKETINLCLTSTRIESKEDNDNKEEKEIDENLDDDDKENYHCIKNLQNQNLEMNIKMKDQKDYLEKRIQSIEKNIEQILKLLKK